MKRFTAVILLLIVLANCKTPAKTSSNFSKSIPSFTRGNFMDDYGILYTINRILWTQHPGIKYHILKWNTKEQYIIARNDTNNPSEAGLYTRIDYMSFENMEPFSWGFCLTVYNAKTDTETETKAKADRQNPKKGCGGFPFSRMKRAK